MYLTWSQIKQHLAVLYGEYVGSGGFIESDAGSPSELAILCNLVHTQIIGIPQDFEFLKVDATIALTGATSYNIRTTYPDYAGTYQVYGLNDRQEEPFVSNRDANIGLYNRGYTLKNGVLIWSDYLPQSGTLNLQIKSSYMVKSAAGARKPFFTLDDDTTVLPFEHIDALLHGVGQFVNWKTDDNSKQRRDFVTGKFDIAMTGLMTPHEQTQILTSMF